MDEMGFYLDWLAAGKTPDDIKQDLVKRGFSENDATDITKHIDEIFLNSKIVRKETRDGSWHTTIGWIVVAASVAISILTFLHAYSFGGWFVIIGGGGGGFSLIRHGLYLENKNIIKRQKGFPRKFQRKR